MLTSYYCLKRVEGTALLQILRKTYQIACSAYNHSMTSETTVRNKQSFNWEPKELKLKCIRTPQFESAVIKIREQPTNLSAIKTVYTRLAEALAVLKKECNKGKTLCVFSYQTQEAGFRRFIVVHPEVYWRYYIKMPSEHRHTYEVLPEGSPCWVYLDLEFLRNLNVDRDGSRMTNTLIDIICAYMLVHFSIHCNKTNVVNFDSTTKEKFSRHLIFSIKDVAFENNLHIGNFVKFICADIEYFLKYNNMHHEILSYFKRSLLKELFVETNVGKQIFIDTSVYNRNRTFRIYKSTKWGKQTYLTVSPDSKHVPTHNCNDKELGIFLDSLISYFPNKKNLITLKFEDKLPSNGKHFCNQQISFKNGTYLGISSPYPQLDKIIAQHIQPGVIYTVSQYDSTLVYGIRGNRYCENIGRWHKSNNIFWVVDLKRRIMYQKCHDIKCSGFRSKPISIPNDIDIYPMDSDTNDFLVSCAALTEECAHLDLSVYDDSTSSSYLNKCETK